MSPKKWPGVGWYVQDAKNFTWLEEWNPYEGCSSNYFRHFTELSGGEAVLSKSSKVRPNHKEKIPGYFPDLYLGEDMSSYREYYINRKNARYTEEKGGT